jgi:3',5'-cyclic AMP phosphodiesterase CpdA
VVKAGTEGPLAFSLASATIGASDVPPFPSRSKPVKPRTAVRLLSALTAALVLLAAAPALAADAKPFTIVVLPDTQMYADHQLMARHKAGKMEDWTRYFYEQTEWIKANREKLNIRFVIHVGDIVQRDKPVEWEVASKAMKTLDGFVPYVIAPGNHDYTGDERSTRINEYFPPKRFAGRPWYAGNYKDSSENTVALFEASGMKFIVLALEFKPRDEVLDWANGLLEKHADRRAIIATHAYLLGNRRAKNLGYKTVGNSSQAMWDKCFGRHKNVFMVLSGHHPSMRLVSKGAHGNTVYELQQDYQFWKNGGAGFLRLYTFLPTQDKVLARTYSPCEKRNVRTPVEEFDFAYPMCGAAKKQ